MKKTPSISQEHIPIDKSNTSNHARQNIFRKPHHFNISVKLGLYDRLCIKKRDLPCKCMEVNEWLKKDPRAVVVDNVVNKGPMLRKDVYLKFAKKLAGCKFAKERNLLNTKSD